MRKKDVIDLRFGFPVLLVNIEVKEIHGELFPVVNGRELRLAVVEQLILKPGRLTGTQTKYLRRWMRMTVEEFAKKLGVSHPAVLKWESKEEEETRMRRSAEMLLRIYAANWLKKERKEWDKIKKALPQKRKELRHQALPSEELLELVNQAVYEPSSSEPIHLMM